MNGPPVTVAQYRYDALGRRIEYINSPQGGTAVTARYYYDGENVVSEYMASSSTEFPARKCVTLDTPRFANAEPPALQTTGYCPWRRVKGLHEELYGAAGLAVSNRRLKEVVVYDTYGEAKIYQWPLLRNHLNAVRSTDTKSLTAAYPVGGT